MGRVTQALTAGVVGVAVVADTEDVPAPRFVVLTARPDTAILEVLYLNTPESFVVICVGATFLIACKYTNCIGFLI